MNDWVDSTNATGWNFITNTPDNADLFSSNSTMAAAAASAASGGSTAASLGAAGIKAGGSGLSSLVSNVFGYVTAQQDREQRRRQFEQSLAYSNRVFSRTNRWTESAQRAYSNAGLDPNLAFLGSTIPMQSRHVGGQVFVNMPAQKNLPNLVSPNLRAILH